MTVDPGVSTELHQIAAILEERVGLEPAPSIVADTELIARLRRVREALDEWVDAIDTEIGSLELSDLVDVDDALSPAARKFLGYDGTEWTALTPLFTDLGDTLSHTLLDDIGTTTHPQIDSHIADTSIHFDEINELSDVIIASPAQYEVLTYDAGSGGIWVNAPTQLQFCADILYTSLSNKDMLQYKSGIGKWENIALDKLGLDHGDDLGGLNDDDHTQYLLEDGTRPLSANWDAGNYFLDAAGFQAEYTTGDASVNIDEIVANITNTASVGGYVDRGLYVDYNYTYNNAAGLDNSTLRCVDIDMDLTTTAAAVSLPVAQLMKLTLDAGASTNMNAGITGNQPVYINIASVNTSQAYSMGAIFLGTSVGASTQTTIGTRSQLTTAGSGAALAYQGYVLAQTGFSGSIKGLEAFTTGVASGASAVYGVSSQPGAAGGTLPTSDKVMAYWSNKGHALFSNSSLWVLASPAGDLSALSPTHVNTTGFDGDGYIQNDLEVDGVVYGDGGVSVLGDSVKAILGADSDVEMYYDGTDFNIVTDIDQASDFLLDCGTNKTLELQETVWDDVVTPINAAGLLGVASDPVLTKLFDDGSGSTGVYGLVFSNGDEVIATVQMPHRWKEGTDIHPHIHFVCLSDVDPSDNFGIEFEYTWCDINEDFAANTTLETNDIATGVNTANMHQTADVTASAISGSGHTISSILLVRIKRVAATSDDYAGDVAILDFDIHYEVDTMGSRQEYTK